ncbi:MAG: NFACT RNA binding domain-containing protein [Myxococcaceae bacterium]
MTLRKTELEQVVAELWPALEGAVVQHVFAHRPGRAYLELRLPGKSVMLHLCAEPKLQRLSLVDAHPKGTPGQPLPWQQVLRRELVGQRLDALTLTAWGVTLGFGKHTLEAELAGHSLLLVVQGRVLATSAAGPARLRNGAEYEPPPELTLPQGPSRLKDPPFARAAEALLTANEQQLSLKAAQAPLSSKLKRLERTLQKVEAEAARGADAERHKRDGELLKQNLHRLERGAKSVTLDEYQADGTVEPRTVKLDPAKPPKLQADWHFHQYRRLTRGAQLAGERAQKLRAEAAALREQLTQLEASELPAVAAKPVSREEERRAFKEYDGAGGKIWVGKGARDNDELTFKVARPHHLWLHARGVTGAHVVVPLERDATAPQELLLDAATLAAHHSQSKGQSKSEVSYTQVKFVKKVKGVAGAVTYTREKTFFLRLEKERLARLLATER